MRKTELVSDPLCARLSWCLILYAPTLYAAGFYAASVCNSQHGQRNQH